jgi:hypothetical protein
LTAVVDRKASRPVLFVNDELGVEQIERGSLVVERDMRVDVHGHLDG